MSAEMEFKVPCREKNWDELDDVGKIERMRLIIKQEQHVIYRLNTIVSRLLRHKHVDGEMMVPLSRGGDGEGSGPGRLKDYF